MTRKEQIINEAQKFSDSQRMCGFIEGAIFADKTMIEKACKWLEDNAGAYQEDLREYGEGCEYDTSSLIEDFKKAMAE